MVVIDSVLIPRRDTRVSLTFFSKWAIARLAFIGDAPGSWPGRCGAACGFDESKEIERCQKSREAPRPAGLWGIPSELSEEEFLSDR